MTFRPSLSEILLGVVLAVGVGTVGWRLFGDAGRSPAAAVREPKLSPLAAEGKIAFDANCAECHGVRGGGTGHGPPLVHDIYNPGHHPDPAFWSAVRHGVRQHHWAFGDMPARPRVTDAELTAIVRYVRELQQANGIVYREHRM